jgi:hypothetical protein
MFGDMSEMSLWLAGETGQAGLARSAGTAGIRASVDQHAAEVRDALGGRLTVGGLLSYAQGFTEAAVARGWWPPHRRPSQPGSEPQPGPEPWLDWESLRLAAVCRLVLEVQGLALLYRDRQEHEDLRYRVEHRVEQVLEALADTHRSQRLIHCPPFEPVVTMCSRTYPIR